VDSFGGGSVMMWAATSMKVVAGALVYPVDPIGVQWNSSPAIWKAIEAH
jgi:hypothetical protein